MAFRNPTHTLPADRITGQIKGTQLAADAIDGKVITGATVRTAAAGRRIVLAPDGNTYWYTGAVGEFAPGRIQSEGGGSPSLSLYGPRMDDMVDYGIKLQEIGASSTTLITTDSTTIVGDANIAGKWSAGNAKWGTAVINPVAGTDTSLTVTGVGLTDTSVYRVLLTANSAAPGAIDGLTATNATADGFTLWINRSTAFATSVWYLVLGR